MVKNFQEVITSLQLEIDQSLTNMDFKKTTSTKRFILERAASDMLVLINSKKSKVLSKRVKS